MKRLPWLLLLAALLLPGVAIVPHSQHVFWLPESALWSILAPFAALAAWWATRGQANPPVPKELQRVFAGLAALWILSGALSLRKDLAAQAVVEWLGYAGIFFATWRLGTSSQRRATLLAALFAYGLLSTLYGVIQAAGWDPIPWSTTFDGRAGGFFGNPNFLGGHMALLLPLSLALALDRRGSTRKAWAGWALVGALGLSLVLTQTRGAWIGAAAGCGLVLVLAQRSMGGLAQRNRKALALVAMVLVGGLALLFAAKPSAWTRWRLSSQMEDSELSRRFFLMKKASQLASLSPLLGVGPGNFRIHFPRVQVTGLKPEQYRQPYVVSEHAHNDFLQMAAEAGVPAALLWAVLMGLVLWLCHQSLPRAHAARQGEGLLTLGVLGGLVALMVHGLANFPFLIWTTQGAAWALAALALRSSAPSVLPAAEEGLIDGPGVAAPSPARPLPRWAAALALTLGFALCAAITVQQGRRLSEDRLWWVGQGELQLKHPELASGWLLAALNLDPFEDRLRDLHGQAEVARELVWNGIGSLRRAHELSPYDPEIAVRLGRALMENKQYDEAQKVLSGAAAICPNFYDLWEPLAAACYFQGKHADAVKAYDWMIFYNVNVLNAYVNKAAAQGMEGQLPEALLTLKTAEKLYPNEGKLYLNLAITYLKLGLRAEAKAAWAKAAILVPSDPQVDDLRKALR